MSSKSVAPENDIAAKGIKISKNVGIIVVISIVISFVAVIIGLSVGLKSAYETDCTKESDTQKYEICKDLSCRNASLLQSKII